ncbi:MAG: L-threonylcarbamoyladenylate synthase [Thermoplasmata archaeon]
MQIIKEDMQNLPKIIDHLKRAPVVMPTETLYAIVAPVMDKSLFDTVYSLKNMKMNTASPIGFYGLRDMERFCAMDQGAKNIVKKLMPGPLTLILNAKVDGHWVVNKKIAARISSNNLIREVAREIGPVTLIGANIRGFKLSSDLKEIIAQFGNKISLYVDGGILKGSPSTIYDYTTKTLIREGSIPIREIRGAENGL